jgi:hypothetical protein
VVAHVGNYQPRREIGWRLLYVYDINPHARSGEPPD